MFSLSAHGPDTFVGTGPRYPWGGLYGGQIVAQALRAAAYSVDADFEAHSIRCYFIRPGDHTEPVRYEVDRIRNGRSFATRRVVARQANGAILNAECSLQRPEASAAAQPLAAPTIDGPDATENTSFSPHFDRRFIDAAGVAPSRDGVGRVIAWMRVVDEVDAGGDGDAPVLHRCWLAYMSDDLASDAVRAAVITTWDGDPDLLMGISLDHTVWFHRPMRSDAWHAHDVSCHHLVGGRGLAVGHVFDEAGTHVATYSQEVLMRLPPD